jgi:sigma-E factor negative regulatory protein RseA
MTDQPNPSAQPAPQQDPRPLLSAFMDGEAGALKGTVQAWRDDPELRQTWHTYHLVGDVLRSDELARRPADDLAFLNQLRSRLHDEPAWVAPLPTNAPAAALVGTGAKPKRALALAAGVAACAVVVASGGWLPGPSQPTVAGLPTAATTVATAAASAFADRGPLVVLRDPRLDEFLRVHQMARGGLAVVVPGGSLRNVDFAGPAGRP